MKTSFLDVNGVSLAVTEVGEAGPVVLLLHGLAGSSRELLATAQALHGCRVLLLDQRGHGASTRRPSDLSRQAFVNDVAAVIEEYAPGQKATVVGQSMGAHTAFLSAAAREDLIESLVMLEGHPAGDPDPAAAAAIGKYFASWPVPFADEQEAREFLGTDAVVAAWIADFEPGHRGLTPRFDADVMEQIIAAVHEPRWSEWENLRVPTLAVFAQDGMFAAEDKDELIRRRPQTRRIDLAGGSHDAHLDAAEEWIAVLRQWFKEWPAVAD